ncbi:MAG TPA: GNAT family N-acetyltransferase [Legionella sp.]|nr:GNAT family N-acetyltransferase [Legionella sp.]
MINKTHQITDQQLKELQQLEALCKKSDGSAPNLYPHILVQPRAFPASLFYYAQNELLGFLSVYFFYDKAVEVSLLVHPAVRRKGIGKELIYEILPLIQSQQYSTLIFSSPAKTNNQWLVTLGFVSLHSEYYMVRNELNPILDYQQSLTYRTANPNDMLLLCALDEACFPQKQNNIQERFQMLLDGREYQIILAFHENKVVGKAHIRWDEQGATLSDIAVMPDRQGKGIGTSLIAHCINLALSEGIHHISLDVETHNKRALNLYTRLGFLVHNACDYWSIEIQQLIK